MHSEESEKTYRNLFIYNPECLWVLDSETYYFIDVNDAAIRHYGYSREEFLSMTALQLRPEKDRKRFIELNRLPNEIPHNTGIWEHIKKDGSIIKVQVSVQNMKYNGRPARLVLSIDVTDKLKYEEERENIIRDLIQRNKALEQFAYIISHNLRAPLANIKGISAILQDSVISREEQTEGLLNLGLSVERLDEVIRDLMEILHVKKSLHEQKTTINFQKLTDNILASLDLRDIDYKIISDFTEVNEVFTIKSYIHSIFYNLIANAVKYRRNDVPGLLEIKSRKENDKIILTFSDNGSGIDLKTRGDEVFGLYKRFHSNVEGRGMGLYMVKTQIETLGGSIDIESEINKGTTFTIILKND